jgi:hypothetical protein
MALPCHEPLFDVHPETGASIEVFYADTGLATFGEGGPGPAIKVAFVALSSYDELAVVRAVGPTSNRGAVV